MSFSLSPEQRYEFALRFARSDTYTVNVRIAHPVNGNLINYGVFDKVTGGEIDSAASTMRLGGMGPAIALGGPPTVGNVIVSRAYRLARDHDVIGQLISSAGRCRAVVTIQPLDINANAYGKPLIYLGVLKRVKAPDIDSESAAAGMLELEIVVDGVPST